jgi:hypothetical protein
MKKDQVVRIPKGTKFLRANPSLLVPDPIAGEMGYDAIGKVDTIRPKGVVSVAVWDAGRSFPWYCNVKASDLDTDVQTKLTYDSKREILTWTFPDGMVHPPVKRTR